MQTLADTLQSDETGAAAARQIPADATIGRWVAGDGWRLRTFARPAPAGPARGSILFLGGRGDHFEKYLEAFAGWHAAGWHVDSVDWRGQGGSGRTVAGSNVGHIDDFSTWVADLADFARLWRSRTPGPHVIMGHSMGGHLLLRALAERVVACDRAVLIAPMLGFIAPYPDRLGVAIAAVMCRLGKPTRAGWRENERPGYGAVLRQRLLTRDDRRYADELWWHAKDPTLALGPGSWGWIAASYRSFVGLGRPGRLEAVDTPVLILGAEGDRLVSPQAIRRAAARLPAATLHLYGGGSAHEILRERDDVRTDALARITAHLEPA